MRRNILVTGFTGRLGGMVAAHLRDHHGLEPRVLVREQHLSDDAWEAPAGMEVAVGDFLDPDSLLAAMQDVEAAFLVSPVHPDMRQRELALAAAAAGQQLQPHIVKISGLGTRLDSFVDSGRWHAEIEHGITELGLSATFLRPFFFMQNLGFQVGNMRDKGELRGAVEDAAIAMVDARDIAEVAAAVLAGETSVEGEAVSLTGDRSYTYDEVATVASVAFDRPVSYLRQAAADVRRGLEQAGQPGWHIDILMQFNEAFRKGWGAEDSDTVATVLGRAPRRLDDYLSEVAGGERVAGNDPFPS